MGSKGEYVPLFETSRGKGRAIYKAFVASVFVGIVSILTYRATNIPAWEEDGFVGWIFCFAAELWFGFYWLLSQSLRWNPTYRRTFKNRLSQRFQDDELPGVDVFVCTADPNMEPPAMVVNTVLSVMAYDYPPEKLSVYVSDDAGSELTFYVLLEASRFAKHWIPFCKQFMVEPRSPAAYFLSSSSSRDSVPAECFNSVKKLYEDMENRITITAKLGRIPENIRSEHKGYLQWNKFSSKYDHHTILQTLIDGRDSNIKDIRGCSLPTLLYLAREKRPKHPHNFKAGAMNALIRVSSKISNGQVILNVDCDMFSNHSCSVRDALCFFLDEEKGNEIAFVQFPQGYENVTKNELYGSSLRVIYELEFHGLDGYGGPFYVGTGCFHRRDSLCGRKFNKDSRIEWKMENDGNIKETASKLEERLQGLASCGYEENTQWGKQMGLKYGCLVEDVITGLSIQCQGWKSVYYNPTRKGFLGVVPTSLSDTLLQHKRWSEGDLQILLSKYSPLRHGVGRISLGLQLGYCTYGLWALNCFGTLYYSIIPSLYLLSGVSLFPQVSSPWLLPFAYVIICVNMYSLVEFLWCQGTILGWWNEQRMWLYKRTTSYLYAFIDVILGLLGLSTTSFLVTNKVFDPDVSQRYEQEVMEFGTSLPMFTILATLALLNLFSLILVVNKVLLTKDGLMLCKTMVLQILLCSLLVVMNLPLYQALFLRKDKGNIPSSITTKSTFLAFFICSCFVFLY
ncbi:cellulose synthase-like protein E1 [Diospyros lotus]|uniref:cellulose synthase-like protein E1 n=1 Tax=Diospyros lotus TaxID=55363 RepID=UPI0022536713|nr:cellulose synthase-like protein E1 [Diospyros lotus]